MISEKEIEQIYWDIKKQIGITEHGDYTKFYTHLKNVFLEGLKRDYALCTIPEFSENFMEAFLVNMRKITMRTLIFEMELSSDCGELEGNTDEEKYRNFAEHYLLDSVYLKDIYKEYPLMYQDMLQYLTLLVRNTSKMLRRFEVDLEEINSRFFKDVPCQRIVTVDGGSSDIHNGGGTILILELDNGEKIVYKPRSLAIDEAYRAFLQWICQNIGMLYWWNTILDRGEYGWCGWVSSVPCASGGEIRRYYQRNGILLCLGYLLGSGDIHYENLIAHGEYPVIIDLELAVGSRGLRKLPGPEGEAGKLYQESVLQTGILPLYAWNADGEGVNVGAINGGGSQLLPLEIPVIVDTGTVRMRVEYRKPKLKEGKNLATLNGEFIQPSEFFHEIKTGFEKTYLFLEENKECVGEKLHLFETVRVRYLVRQTQEYSILLTALHHPNFLTTEEERDGLLNSEIFGRDDGRTNEMCWIHIQEIAEMKRGDIPYFWYSPYGTSLHSGTGEFCKDYFPLPVIHEVCGRLSRLKRSDMKRQERLMRMALFLGEKKSPVKEMISRNRAEVCLPDCSDALHEKVQESVGRKAMGISIAEKIGEILLDEAIWSDDRKDVGWISIMMAGYRERGYLIRPMGLYLYDGLAGIAVFMYRLAKETGKACYREIIEILVQKLFTYTDDCGKGMANEIRPTGAFSGEASIAFAYLLMYLEDGKPEFLDYLRRQCKSMVSLFEKDTNYDVLGGNAGAILVLLGACDVTGDRQYAMWAKVAGDALLRSAISYEWGLGWVNPLTGTALTGFAHGAAGLMLALTKLGYYTEDERYFDAAYQAFLFEEHYFDKTQQDWKDLRFPSRTENEEHKTEEERVGGHSVAWCHGWGGTVMARMIAGKYAKGEFRSELDKATEVVKKHAVVQEEYRRGGSYCLCHGKCGNSSLYFACKEWEVAWRLEKNIMEELGGNKEGIQEMFEMQECSNYGLMGGITGVGYRCLCGMEETMKVLGIEF